MSSSTGDLPDTRLRRLDCAGRVGGGGRGRRSTRDQAKALGSAGGSGAISAGCPLKIGPSTNIQLDFCSSIKEDHRPAIPGISASASRRISSFNRLKLSDSC